MISLARLQELLARYAQLRIALLGDLFLDRYLDLDPELQESSIETGLEAYQVTRIRNSPGALGTVMNNLAALGVGYMLPVAVLGDDGQAYDLVKELKRLPVDDRLLYRDPGRLTPTYTKPMKRDASGVWHELNRLDLRNCAPLSPATEKKVIESTTAAFEACDGLIVVDQVNEENWGVVTAAVREHLAELGHRTPGKLIFVDSRAQVARFRHVTLKPNVGECLTALGRSAAEKDQPGVARQAARELSELTGCPLFCTLGERGVLVVRPPEEPVEVPSYPVTGPVDTVGAGDSATAGMVSALLAGATPVEAGAIGNLVASITVQQLGTTGTASRAQVISRWHETQRA
ncbi:MAG TPA: PfkB family carbohydrate kinase [Pirellulales bacterium]|jgi:rfaE bifunctional protein kinase chain/domain|nr:PfkB family carbohydrate kinase [Pirellulales bacterium]